MGNELFGRAAALECVLLADGSLMGGSPFAPSICEECGEADISEEEAWGDLPPGPPGEEVFGDDMLQKCQLKE